MTLYIFQSEHF